MVGTATLSTPVGATSLGNYIFSGLQTQNHTAVLVGCVSAAGLAMLLDGLIRLIEVSVIEKNMGKMIVAGVGLAIVVLGGLSSFAVGATTEKEKQTVLIGSKPFTEQFILNKLIGHTFEKAGFNVDSRGSMGSTILFDALKNNNITCYVDYSGTLWANVMNREDKQPSEKVVSELTDWLDKEHGILCLGALGFENTYALAVNKRLADSLNLKTIADLSRHASSLTIGSDYEFFSRPE